MKGRSKQQLFFPLLPCCLYPPGRWSDSVVGVFLVSVVVSQISKHSLSLVDLHGARDALLIIGFVVLAGYNNYGEV